LWSSQFGLLKAFGSGADKLRLVGIVERAVVAVPDGAVEAVVPGVLAGGLESGMAHGIAPFTGTGRIPYNTGLTTGRCFRYFDLAAEIYMQD
jgi:hypothetical protein